MIEHEVGPYAIVPLWVFDALVETQQAEAIRLYVILHRWTAGENRTCHPSRQTIADACGVTTRTIDRWATALKDVGALRVEARWDEAGDRTTNSYVLIVARPRSDASVGSDTGVQTGSDTCAGTDTGAARGGDTDVAENQTHPEPDVDAPVLSSVAAQQTPEPARAVATATRKRAPDPLFDAMAEVCGIIPCEMTRTLHGQASKAVEQLRKVGATPDEVPRRADVYRAMYPENTLTPAALCKHWAMLREMPTPVARNGTSVFDRAMALRESQRADLRVVVVTPQRAEELARHLVAATTGWNEDSILELTDELTKWGDLECAEAAIDYVRTYWAERSRPPLGWIIRAYNVEMDAKRRDEELNAPPVLYPVGPPPKDGREIALQAMRDSIHLTDDEARVRFGMSLEARMSLIESVAPDDEQNRAIVAIGRGAMYATVLRVFGGDHVKATRAVRTLEKRGAVVHGNDGWITVRYTDAQ